MVPARISVRDRTEIALGYRHGLVGNCKGLLDDGLGGEPPGARRVDRGQPKLLAHVHPAIEAEGDIERVEDEVACAGMEIAEFGRKPDGEAGTQQPAQMGDAQADGWRDAAHAFGEMPYRQPLLEELGAVRYQQLDAVGERRLGVHGAVAIECTGDGQIEGRGIEIGEAGEVLEERPARNPGDGRDRSGGRLDIAGLDKVQGRLDQSLASPQAANDAAILRT